MSDGQIIDTHTYNYEYSDNKWKMAKGEKFGRLTGHSLHYIGPYSGSFPPELVHYFICKYSDPNDIIFDPFSGRGTTGLQTILNNRQAIVNDANPLAYVYSKAKLFPYSSKMVKKYLENILLKEEFELDQLRVEKIDELLSYFHPDTLKELEQLRHFLTYDDSNIANYIKALLAGVSQGNRISNLTVTMSALICFSSKYIRSWCIKKNIFPEYREVKPRIVAKAERLEKDGLDFRRDSIILCEDVTKLCLEDNSVDLIITSPPYLNVINYSYDNRLRLWLIGYDHKEIHKKLMHTSSIPKYSEFLSNTLKSLYKILKDDSWAIFVLGDVKRKTQNTKGTGIKSTIINTAEIVANAAKKEGFQVDKIINDILPAEGGTCGRATSLTNSFNVSIDRCVVLKKGKAEERNNIINWDNLIQIH